MAVALREGPAGGHRRHGYGRRRDRHPEPAVQLVLRAESQPVETYEPGNLNRA